MPDFDRRKWNARYADASAAPSVPSRLCATLAAWLPREGKALDVAGGAGRHSIWLARRGLDVTLADISENGLRIAQTRAAGAGAKIHTQLVDLAEEPFPTGPWDVILSFHYLQRALFAEYPRALAPHGLLVVVQPTKRNLERHAKPPAPFLLDERELPSLPSGLEILRYEEGWLEEGRHDALLVARKN